VYKILSKPRLGELRIQKKVVLNENSPNYLDVAIGEIELVRATERDELHYIVSFGGGQTVRIIGKDNWAKFVDMIQWLDWDPEETQEFCIDERPETYDETLEYEVPWFEDDDEIIEGAPIDDE
jgi:hypothetical protein